MNKFNNLITATAPLEGYGDLSMIAFGLWMISYGVMLAVILIVVNTIITQLKLETHKFITDRPFLHKLIMMSSKGRNAVTYSMILVALLGSYAMYYYLEMLIELLKTLNL